MTNTMIATRTVCILSLASFAACSSPGIHEPLENAAHRAKPLSFGLHVTSDPDLNPIDPPERFSGIHAAQDFEVSAGELDGDVPVYAICSGKVVYGGYADGYGGLVVHRCKIDGEHVTVLYGHLALTGMVKEGSAVRAGQTIGLLAPARSYESGMNRKHLHLGIHKGKTLDLRGYVQTEEDLATYLDPLTVLSSLFLNLPGESPGEVPYWQQEADGN